MTKPIKSAPLVLSEAQQSVVKEIWDKEDLVTVAQRVFALPDLESHAPEVKAVRSYIATLGQPLATVVKEKKPLKGPVKLTEAQVTNIAAMLNRDEPPTVREITLMMFPDIKDLTPLHGEYKAVYAAVRDINEEAVSIWDEPVENRRYRPPISYPAMIGAINRHVGNPHDPQRALFDAANMKSQHERNIKALLSYMKTQRFVLSASQYDKKADRDLFESSFVNLTYDKAADLLPEDVDMYVSAAIETVEGSKFQRDIIRYERVINDYMDGDLDGEKRSNLSKPFVDALTALRQKAGESKKRHTDLLNGVAGARGKRIESKAGVNESLINFLALWTEEEDRNRLLEFAKQEHEEDGKEFERLRDLDDVMALVAGQSANEARGGL
jgi:hypothetical protein